MWRSPSFVFVVTEYHKIDEKYTNFDKEYERRDMKDNLITSVASDEHLALEMKQFRILRRKIRMWLKNNNKSALELVNLTRRIQNTFTRSFIEITIDHKFGIEERKIVNTILGRVPPHHEFGVKLQAEMRKG